MIHGLVRTLIRKLGKDKKYFLLRELANDLAIASATKQGRIGPIEGNLNDWTIFRRYVHGEVWEEGTSKLCIDFFRRFGTGTFVDVGANIGMIFIPVLQQTGCRGIAIEASPVNFDYLRSNCARNLPADRVRLLNFAVGDANGTVRFETSTTNFGDHKVSESGGIEVDCKRFDDVAPDCNLQPPILAKVDIQGSELRFFRGASAFLKRLDGLILEYSPFDPSIRGDIAAYDATIRDNFTKMAMIRELPEKAIPAPEGLADVTQDALDRMKEKISARTWTNAAEGHENILLLKNPAGGARPR